MNGKSGGGRGPGKQKVEAGEGMTIIRIFISKVGVEKGAFI